MRLEIIQNVSLEDAMKTTGLADVTLTVFDQRQSGAGIPESGRACV